MCSLAQALTPPFSKKRSCGARSRIRGVKSMIYSNKEYSVFGNLCKKADGDNARSIRLDNLRPIYRRCRDAARPALGWACPPSSRGWPANTRRF